MTTTPKPKTSNPFRPFITIDPRNCLRFCGGVFLALAWLAVADAQAQTTNYALGTTSLLVGPVAGTNSVVLAVTPQTAPWTNTANAGWLHLSLANQTGEGSTNVIFSFDANPGPTRTGTLTIASQILAVTQAGSTYVAANPVTTLVSTGQNQPYGVAVDGAGNVYITYTQSGSIMKWTATNGNVTTLVSSGLSFPQGVAVDGWGNVYIADTDHSAIKEWKAATGSVITLVSSGLDFPEAVTVDGTGNVYIADTDNDAIKLWTAANSGVTTLVSGLALAQGVAVDGAGNIYCAYSGNYMISEWMAGNSNIATLPISGLWNPHGLAVDGAGNVYIADSQNGAIKKWTAANGSVTTLPAELDETHMPEGVAVDRAGNVYFADTVNSAIKELTYAFVDATPKLEGPAAGNDAIVVLPATENLAGPFTPISSDPSWLTISGISNGVVSLAFTATTSNRTAFITLLGQAIPVTQGIAAYSLGTTTLLEGPAAGSDSVVLAVYPNFAAWTNAANAAWLHLSQANQSGTGSTNVVFSYDANPSATRSGTLTIAGQTLTVTQAGSTYVAAGPVTTLVSSGLSHPWGVAVDGVGNVYIADKYDNAIKEWTMANNTVTTLISSGLDLPNGVAVDGAGNVYIADSYIYEWTVPSSNLNTLVSSGLGYPYGVAVDGMNNVYFSSVIVNPFNGQIATNLVQELISATGSVITLASKGLQAPQGLAVDVAGNVYIADTVNNAIKEWSVANNTVTPLVSSGLLIPQGVAVDGAGNVYISDTYHNVIKKWTAASGNVTTLVASGLGNPNGLAVDGTGNVYIGDSGGIKELPRAFVDPTPRSESLAAGSDVLPGVLPDTENLLPPFAPTSDQSWLTMTGITNGVVSFSFTANTGLSRTAHITLLGQTIPITQAGVTPPTLTSVQTLANGACLFCFTNTAGASFTVLSTTDVSLPLSNWVVAGTATIISPGLFQFTTPPMTNDPQRFYTVRSP